MPRLGEDTEHGVHAHALQDRERRDGSGSGADRRAISQLLVVIAALAILAAGIYVRTGLLRYQGLFEPDGFFYYAVIKQTLASGLRVPADLLLSGFPAHNFIGEAPGLILLAALPAAVLHGAGISALTVMRLMPILFAVLEMILAFLIAKQISRSNALGILAMALIAFSSGNIARTAGTVYRGDSFVSLFLMVSLFFVIAALKRDRRDRRFYAYAFASGAVLSLGIVIWNGAPFIVAVYMLALVLLFLYGFAIADKELLAKTIVLGFALLLCAALQVSYVHAGLARPGQALEGRDFLIYYTPLMLAGGLMLALVARSRAVAANRRMRYSILLAIVVVAAAGLGAYMSVHNVQSLEALGIFTSHNPCTGASTSATATRIGCGVGASTQELQKPAFTTILGFIPYSQFLFSSFGLQLYLAPLGVALFVLFALRIDENRHRHHAARAYLNIAPAFLVLLAYLCITAVLQASAIRYNALFSIPIALFAAYALFGAYRLLRARRMHVRGAAVAALVLIAALALFGYYGVGSAMRNLRALPSLAAPYRQIVMVQAAGSLAVFITLMAALAYCLMALPGGGGRRAAAPAAALIILAILIFTAYATYGNAFAASQADGINPLFLQAMVWMRYNTPANATTFNIWPDGSVIEGWADRTAYVDSVGGENATRIYQIARFLFNDSGDQQYLYSIGRPDYIVARSFWFQELAGLAQEGMIQNVTRYGEIALAPYTIQRNGTSTYYLFNSPPYRALLITRAQQNGTTRSFNGYVGSETSPAFSEVNRLIFYNTSSFGYSIENASAANALNYTMVVDYSGNSISGAQIIGPALLNSNFYKLTTLCNFVACGLDGNGVTLRAVYINSDTRIFRVYYNSTESAGGAAG